MKEEEDIGLMANNKKAIEMKGIIILAKVDEM